MLEKKEMEELTYFQFTLLGLIFYPASVHLYLHTCSYHCEITISFQLLLFVKKARILSGPDQCLGQLDEWFEMKLYSMSVIPITVLPLGVLTSCE